HPPASPWPPAAKPGCHRISRSVAVVLEVARPDGAADGAWAMTELRGDLLYQAALLGVLTTLYDLGLPLLGVACTPSPRSGRAEDDRVRARGAHRLRRGLCPRHDRPAVRPVCPRHAAEGRDLPAARRLELRDPAHDGERQEREQPEGRALQRGPHRVG